MAESVVKEGRTWRFAFAVAGIMSTLVIYGVLQEKIMRVPYGKDKEYFKYSLFIVFCNRITTSAVSAGALLASKKALDPVAPIYKYCAISVSNILTTTCQYEALKYVSFPVQTLAKCAKMIPVMVWGTVIMQKKYNGKDYLFALLVTLGCSFFVLYPVGSLSLGFFSYPTIGILVPVTMLCCPEYAYHGFWHQFIGRHPVNSGGQIVVNSYMELSHASTDVSPYNAGRESTIWGVSLMLGYLGFDGFTSTFQDKLFKGYDMEIHNQIFYTTMCSCILSLFGLVVQGQFTSAIEFMFLHHDCFLDVVLLSSVATASQFFISYTIRTFGALTFATIMTTRQLLSIMLSCVWFAHPLSWEQWIGAAIVFGSLYLKALVRTKEQKPVSLDPEEGVELNTDSSKSQG